MRVKINLTDYHCCCYCCAFHGICGCVLCGGESILLKCQSDFFLLLYFVFYFIDLYPFVIPVYRFGYVRTHWAHSHPTPMTLDRNILGVAVNSISWIDNGSHLCKKYPFTYCTINNWFSKVTNTFYILWFVYAPKISIFYRIFHCFHGFSKKSGSGFVIVISLKV